MPRQCTICGHAKRDEIDEALVNGTSLRNIAERYGTSTTAIHRHKKHLPAYLAKAKDAKAVVKAGDLLGQLESLLDRAWGILNKTENKKQYSVALGAIREARELLKLKGQLHGEVKENVTVVVLQPVGYEKPANAGVGDE